MCPSTRHLARPVVCRVRAVLRHLVLKAAAWHVLLLMSALIGLPVLLCVSAARYSSTAERFLT